MRRTYRTGIALLVAGGLVTAGCGSDEARDISPGTSGEVEGDRGWLDGGSFESGDGAGGGADARVAESADEAGAPAPMTEGAPASTTVPGDAEADVGLRAGSVDDNERWEDYLLYRQEFDRLGLPISPIDVEGRQVITVTDADGQPVLGATVRVIDGSGEVVDELRTYADGRTLFHAPTEVDPDSQSRPTYRLEVSLGEASTEAALDPETNNHTVTLEVDRTEGPLPVDVLFLIDATGSMGDEIARLQANVISVAEQVAALPGDPDVRFAMTVYRDHGDSFVTRTFDFTGDVASFSDALREVVADGGGDLPEALDEGLHDALTKPAWRGDDAVKLLFLVADAPPHLDDDRDPDYADDVRRAASMGVKIVPIASSGLDPQGEYVFRQLAQVTMGRFVFLTYGADGASPGDSTPHSVDDYSVLALDELVVRFVDEELAHQRR